MGLIWQGDLIKVYLNGNIWNRLIKGDSADSGKGII